MRTINKGGKMNLGEWLYEEAYLEGYIPSFISGYTETREEVRKNIIKTYPEDSDERKKLLDSLELTAEKDTNKRLIKSLTESLLNNKELSVTEEGALEAIKKYAPQLF